MLGLCAARNYRVQAGDQSTNKSRRENSPKDKHFWLHSYDEYSAFMRSPRVSNIHLLRLTIWRRWVSCVSGQRASENSISISIFPLRTHIAYTIFHNFHMNSLFQFRRFDDRMKCVRERGERKPEKLDTLKRKIIGLSAERQLSWHHRLMMLNYCRGLMARHGERGWTNGQRPVRIVKN